MDSKQVKVLQLINAFRFRGHQNANLDPLGLWKRESVPDLDPAFHNLTKEDFEETFNVGSFAIGKETMKLGDIYEALKRIYCGSIGAEYMHITNTEEKRWIQQRLESVNVADQFTKEEKIRFLAELTAAEGLERYWVQKNNKHAGATTNTLPNAKCLYLAVRGEGSALAVAGIAIEEE